MTPEERSLLERTAALAEENNKILRSMQRKARWQAAFQIGYWVIIIALTFGAFYFIQPYINSLMGALSQANGTGTSTSQSQSMIQELQSVFQ